MHATIWVLFPQHAVHVIQTTVDSTKANSGNWPQSGYITYYPYLFFIHHQTDDSKGLFACGPADATATHCLSAFWHHYPKEEMEHASIGLDTIVTWHDSFVWVGSSGVNWV